jgi:hypothetical protein
MGDSIGKNSHNNIFGYNSRSMNKLFICAMLLACCTASAQTVSSGLDAQTNVDALGTDNINGMVRKFDARYEGIRGTPYMAGYWNNGTIFLKSGKSLQNVPLKIDLYGYEVISKRASGDSIIVKANTYFSQMAGFECGQTRIR